MARIIRYTTPVHVLHVRGIDLTGRKVYVTYRQEPGHNIEPVTVTKTGLDMAYDDEAGETVITCPLTQEETGGFVRGRATVTVNWIDRTGDRDATAVTQVLQVIDNALEEVIDFGD